MHVLNATLTPADTGSKVLDRMSNSIADMAKDPKWLAYLEKESKKRKIK